MKKYTKEQCNSKMEKFQDKYLKWEHRLKECKDEQNDITGNCKPCHYDGTEWKPLISALPESSDTGGIVFVEEPVYEYQWLTNESDVTPNFYTEGLSNFIKPIEETKRLRK